MYVENCSWVARTGSLYTDSFWVKQYCVHEHFCRFSHKVRKCKLVTLRFRYFESELYSSCILYNSLYNCIIARFDKYMNLNILLISWNALKTIIKIQPQSKLKEKNATIMLRAIHVEHIDRKINVYV